MFWQEGTARAERGWESAERSRSGLEPSWEPQGVPGEVSTPRDQTIQSHGTCQGVATLREVRKIFRVGRREPQRIALTIALRIGHLCGQREVWEDVCVLA